MSKPNQERRGCRSCGADQIHADCDEFGGVVLDSERSPERYETEETLRQEIFERVRDRKRQPPPEAGRPCEYAFPAPEAPAVAETCKWTLDPSPDVDIWKTSCGEAFVFETDGPTANKMRFCCYCGKQLEEVVIQHDDSE